MCSSSFQITVSDKVLNWVRAAQALLVDTLNISGNTYFKNNDFLSVCSGSSSANMGHYREVSRAGFSMPVHQVYADCWHVCFLLYDSCHDSRPAPCHLLPVAGLPRGHSVPLEHSCHGGLGPGAAPQHTAGRKERTGLISTRELKMFVYF